MNHRDGWYEFGRNDGNIEPVLVRIEMAEGTPVPTSGDDTLRSFARFALSHAGYWWKRVNVPDILPIVLGADHYHWTVNLPPPPRCES